MSGAPIVDDCVALCTCDGVIDGLGTCDGVFEEVREAVAFCVDVPDADDDFVCVCVGVLDPDIDGVCVIDFVWDGVTADGTGAMPTV